MRPFIIEHRKSKQRRIVLDSSRDSTGAQYYLTALLREPNFGKFITISGISLQSDWNLVEIWSEGYA